MTLRIDHDGPVTVLTLHRPESRNALSAELITALRSTLARLGDDDTVRAVVLTGTDPAFCAGLDLKELAGSGANLDLTMSDGSGPWTPIGKPVIAAVNGVAVTGGLEIALACDVRIAGERAVFADTHARVGVMPGWGLTVRLPRIVGSARALEMSLAGARIDAETALTWGLVSRVVPHAELLPTALDLAHRMAQPDPVAAHTLLRMYRDAAEHPPEEALRREHREARAWSAAMDRSRVPSPAQLKAAGDR
jgi:enoyl-CoA hydratase